MTLKPFSNFKSLETHHCVTGSMLHIFEHNNCPVSEDLLLGLGAGVGFIYWHMKGTIPFLGGRANTGRPGEEGMERTACRRLGVDVELIQTGSACKAEKSLLEFLEAGEPVQRLPLPERFVAEVELSADGRTFVTRGFVDDGALGVWQRASLQPQEVLVPIDGENEPYINLAISPRGRYVAAMQRGRCLLWQLP